MEEQIDFVELNKKAKNMKSLSKLLKDMGIEPERYCSDIKCKYKEGHSGKHSYEELYY